MTASHVSGRHRACSSQVLRPVPALGCCAEEPPLREFGDKIITAIRAADRCAVPELQAPSKCVPPTALRGRRCSVAQTCICLRPSRWSVARLGSGPSVPDPCRLADTLTSTPFGVTGPSLGHVSRGSFTSLVPCGICVGVFGHLWAVMENLAMFLLRFCQGDSGWRRCRLWPLRLPSHDRESFHLEPLLPHGPSGFKQIIASPGFVL